MNNPIATEPPNSDGLVLTRRELALMAGKGTPGFLAVFTYSMYKIIRLGPDIIFYKTTYIPLLVSLFGWLGVMVYVHFIGKKSNVISITGGLSAYFGGCYIFFYMGLFGIYQLFNGFN